MIIDRSSLLQQAQTHLLKGRYGQAALLYEQLIEAEPEAISHYCYLGLAYLLQGQEEEAQAIWLSVMVEGISTEEEAHQRSKDLVKILEAEALRQASQSNLQACKLIRQHLREIEPENAHNLINLIIVCVDTGDFYPELLEEWQVANYLRQTSVGKINADFLLEALKRVLKFPSPNLASFVEAAFPHAPDPNFFVYSVIAACVRMSRLGGAKEAISLVELCYQLLPSHSNALKVLSNLYSNTNRHQEAITKAKQYDEKCETVVETLESKYTLLMALMSAGDWSCIDSVAHQQKTIAKKIIQDPPETVGLSNNQCYVLSCFFLPYLADHPRENRWFQNQMAELFQKGISPLSPRQPLQSEQQQPTKPLKIGYIANTFRKHSVGWLCRWLFKYHDRKAFQIAIYLVSQKEDALTQDFFAKYSNLIRRLDEDYEADAAQIQEDEIDILIELDSITSARTCSIIALKPAPIQVSWLGWDASGIPAIDYFIADPYVLPANAQEYYREKIWRLPQTYVAVDGFEVGVPTLRRDHLGIPQDATIYYSAQRGYKRHPNTARLQMKILKEVPNSYFLLKGLADQNLVKEFFTQLAEEEGVDPNRIHILSLDPHEFVHRANLGIADVVLDTYPYNGATTTLETLWAGIPLVTRVGEQFAARNSYTFMTNAGITEGIAWTDEEYIEWGIRLGKDKALREQISLKLRASRQTAPLWNAEKFTREMEKAYQQMWQQYMDTL